MEQRANTTYIRYDHCGGRNAIELTIRAIVNNRDHHAHTRAGDWQARIESVAHGLQITAGKDAVPFYVLSDRASATPQHQWLTGYYLNIEDYRGQEAIDDNLHAGLFTATLQPGQSLTLVAGISPDPDLDGVAAYARQQAHERQLLADARLYLGSVPPEVEQLVLAADQFIVRRGLPGEPEGRSVIAGYHWFSDWGRDTMISLPGLALATGRHQLAARILRTFARFVSRGMLPNRFPDEGQAPEYNTVDATLWYFEAVRAYTEATGDDLLLHDLFPALQEIVDWHLRGSRYQIHADPAGGLLYAGEPGVQLTWMDAKVDEWVVTPRIGKPVEINALWYNALRIMADFARILGDSTSVTPAEASTSARAPRTAEADRSSCGTTVRRQGVDCGPRRARGEVLSAVGQRSPDRAQEPMPTTLHPQARVGLQFNTYVARDSLVEHYTALADQVRASFSRFWNDETGHCHDVIDGPGGDDPSLRPNQLLAVSLSHSPLNPQQQKAVVDACAHHLLTPHGLRSLAPDDPAYIGHYGGDRRTRDAAYHQGTVWGWLLGPFATAHLRVYDDPAVARSFLEPLMRQLTSHGLGSLSEIFDGDPPHTPRGCIAQAWTVAEVLRAWQETKGRESSS
jgi:glycogen debranching enzyme